MYGYPTWKAVLIGLVCLLSLVFVVPNLFPRATVEAWPEWMPQRQITLGLDLQGGSHLLMEVDIEAVVRERLESIVDEVRGALAPERIGYRNLGLVGDRVAFTLRDPDQRAAAQARLQDLNAPIANATGFASGDSELDIEEDGDRFVLGLTEAGRSALVRRAVDQSLEVIRRRIDETGTREPTIQRQGDDRVLVQVPGVRDPEAIKRLIGQTAKLTFHMVDMNASVADARAGRLPPGTMLLEGRDGEGDYVVERRVEVSGENLVDAQPSFQTGEPVVSFRFDQQGARRFGRITQDNVDKLFAIVLDDEVISAPRIREPILGGSGVISGTFTVESANELAVLLRAGALPAPLTVVEERSVGPDLGADSIAAGETAGVIAVVAVAVAMGIYYGTFGLFAVGALLVNLVMLMALLSLLQATLTLPGIAGIVLTMGMAVDANVLIFERIREEVARGRTSLSAINAGFSEATRTIIDANVTTLIAAVLLFQFGSGPVKGFAVTLSIGIATTMFTAIVLTRLFVALWYGRRRPAALPL